MLSNKVHEIMTTQLTSAPVTAPVHEVLRQMIAEDVGRIVITDNEVPVGVFTEKDVLKRVVYPGLNGKQTAIKSVMSSPIRAVREETHIVEAFKRMYRGKYRHLLVRGRRGRIVGIVSMRRILKIAVELGQGASETQTLTNIAATDAVCVDPTESVAATVQLLVRKELSSVVVGSPDEPLGIFTERDVLKRVALAEFDRRATKVQEVMTAPVVTLPETTLIGDALAEMYRRDIRNLPMMDSNGQLRRIISMPDVLRYARAFDVDEQVRRTWKEVAASLADEDQYTPG
ncbi:MAG: CBS domain-containing protein [Deltaproteobacteria bacterium]|nr:CBS domain-containing protein [Deltaproteobacteria bacterium]